jgi:FHS family glucose/mannose:H+ symporter-like MFS transporter
LSRLEFAACVTLGVIGVYSTSFGPAMSTFAADFDVSLDRAGLLLTVAFLGSIAASGGVAVRLHRFDPRVFTGTGLLLLAAGMAGLGFAPSFGAALASIAVAGLGGGLMDAGCHTIVARVSVDVPRGINRLNVCFAAGAIIGPLLSGSVLAMDEDGRWLIYSGIAMLALGAASLMLTTAPVAAADEQPAKDAPAERLGMSRLAWIMGAVLFLYVGAEFGLGSWVASYADEEFEAGVFAGGVITAAYWGALMCGRLISGALFARAVPPGRVLMASIAAGMVTSAGIAAANDVFALAVVAACLTGLAFGPVWPAAMAIATAERSRSAPAALVTIGNSGGLVFPWLQGRLLVSQGATTGIALSAVLCVAMLALAWRGRTPKTVGKGSPNIS